MSDRLLVVRSLLLDRAAAAAIRHLGAAGIPSILLKGPTIGVWLYHHGEVRPYTDIDLLVAPAQFDAAKNALAALGYVHRLDGADPAEFGPLEQELVGPQGACIDLHHGLLGTSRPAEHCWASLVTHTVPFRLSVGYEVTALDIPARAMHLALHAAQGGPMDEQAANDLRRGLDQLTVEDWRQAAFLAEELGAAQSLAAGLRLSPMGARLARELSLPNDMTIDLALRVASAPRHALFFERLSEAPDARRKVALVMRKLFPTAVLLRTNSSLANRGRAGFLLARISHPLAVVARSLPALLAWRRAHRAVVSSSGPAAGGTPPPAA